MKTNNIKFLLVALSCLFAVSVSAQQIITMNSSTHNTTVTMTTCSATLYDSGGASGNYSNSENYTITVCAPSGYPMELEVSMNTENTSWDYLSIYEGTSTSGTTIANHIGSTSSGTAFNASYSLNSSCATFVWHSDGSVNYPGFAIQISCGMECQDFTIVPDEVLPM